MSQLAQRLGLTHGTILAWRSGRTKNMNGALWVQRALPVLLEHMTEEERLTIVPPHVLAYVSAMRDASALGQASIRKSSGAKARPQASRGKPAPPLRLSDHLTEDRVFVLAKDWFNKTGSWPLPTSGPVESFTWHGINRVLREGGSNLPGGDSLAKLLKRRNIGRRRIRLKPLSVAKILRWADEHHARTGEWPTRKTGQVADTKWNRVDNALMVGLRSLPGGSSLAKLLEKERGVPRKRRLRERSPLSAGQILAWADEHHARTGQWPILKDGQVGDTKWSAIDAALRYGKRNLPGGSSLVKLLERERGVPRRRRRPRQRSPLSVEQILAWMDEHHARTGKWPRAKPVPVGGTTWLAISIALSKGDRGLPGGSSLAKLLKESRGATNHPPQTKLPVEQILAWADEHQARTGEWPTHKSGAAGWMTWHGVNAALNKGRRGFPGGSSLGRLLTEHGRRSLRSRGDRPQSPLPQEQIFAWADEHFKRTGRWPSANSKAVHGQEGEVWRNIDTALKYGRRGLPAGSSLAKLLASRKGPGVA